MGHGKDLAALRHGDWMTPPVEIIAHRGANREAPENTLPAFEKALDGGADGIELDVHLTGDGVPVVHHDPTIRGEMIVSMTAVEVQKRKHVPNLADVIALVDGRCRLYVEVKAAAATEAVIRMLAPHHDWCAIHSFDHRIPAAAGLHGELKTGVLLSSYLVNTVAAMDAAGATDLWQQASFIDSALVADVHAVGRRVIAWTVNDLDQARGLIAMGVDAICTDIPREMRAVTSRSSG